MSFFQFHHTIFLSAILVVWNGRYSSHDFHKPNKETSIKFFGVRFWFLPFVLYCIHPFLTSTEKATKRRNQKDPQERAISLFLSIFLTLLHL